MILSEENLSPKRLLFQYMKMLSKSDKLKAFIAPLITYLITFPANNGNLLSTQGKIFMESTII